MRNQEYGSWAKGMNRQYSDLDALFRAEVRPFENDLARLQRDLSLKTKSEVDLLVLTPEKLDRIKREDPPFLQLSDHVSNDIEG